MNYFNEFGFDGSLDDSDYPPSVLEMNDTSNAILYGDGNSPPVISDTATQGAPSVVQLLGSIGTTARDVGTAVGTLQRGITDARKNYSQARTAASTGNSLSTWWQYASTTDKLMVGLAIVGIIVALKD